VAVVTVHHEKRVALFHRGAHLRTELAYADSLRREAFERLSFLVGIFRLFHF
jgi:hypothetical protein